MLTTPTSVEGWVRRVNDRWIVHEGLNEAARAYLDHLSEVDPGRYVKACAITWNLIRSKESGVDPKPLFYGGLFSVATRDEMDRFLSKHLFTALLSPVYSDAQVDQVGTRYRLGEETLRKLHEWRVRIRTALASLPEPLQEERSDEG